MTRTAVFVGLTVLATSTHSSAQSLGQLAQEEAARRRIIASPARIVSNLDLSTARRLTLMGVPVVATPAAPAEPVAPRVLVEPAVYRSGAVPQIPIQAVSGGEVVLELSVDSQGHVADVAVLRDTPPFTASVVAAVRGWQFRPAETAAAPAPGEPIRLDTRRAADSKVLVVGLFRPPALFPVTLGQAPADVAAPSNQIPVAAGMPAMPLYSPQALFDDVLLAEVRVGQEGVASARILRSAPGLDLAALDVLRSISFRPAVVDGSAATSLVYVVAAFRQPIIR